MITEISPQYLRYECKEKYQAIAFSNMLKKVLTPAQQQEGMPWNHYCRLEGRTVEILDGFVTSERLDSMVARLSRVQGKIKILPKTELQLTQSHN